MGTIEGNMTKILLVEDDKSLREIYGVRLLAEGYDIVSAGDGEEALAMAIKERPELIVSDVMMPKISGFDMLDILRSTTETKDIKVIMMTALSSEDQRARGVALGADRYLVKSQVGIEDVVRTVHDVLGDAPVTRPTGLSFNSTTPAPRPTTPVPSRPIVASSNPSVQTQTPPLQTTRPIGAPSAPLQTPQLTRSANPIPSNSLPQPTAPFSTARPANLGERVIHPITPPSAPSGQQDIGTLMDQELSQAGAAPIEPTPAPIVPSAPSMPTPAIPPDPTPQPVTTQAPEPQQPSAPATLAPAEQPSGIQFEETPLPPAPPQPSAPLDQNTQPPHA